MFFRRIIDETPLDAKKLDSLNAVIDRKDLSLDDAASGTAKEFYQLGQRLKGKRQLERALSAFREGWKHGHVNSTYQCGLLERDTVEANRLFQKAAERGHVRAKFNLGTYWLQQGNTIQAQQTLEDAASQGCARSKTNLGILHAVNRRDPQEGLRWFREAIADGDSAALLGGASAALEAGEYACAERWAEWAVALRIKNAPRLLRTIKSFNT
ncbi:tetratricopeptide repeat protein [Pseudobythopirellula maris]|uniref:tetratricopeptide repeat protein n=1 Tax=Pseudobythopirellula maris TaxID=2527991 RepID=UPI0011B413B4|nr:SEL1-like repeat protein [Pseudobythopirellula maris]